jgi:hypothetical protein
MMDFFFSPSDLGFFGDMELSFWQQILLKKVQDSIFYESALRRRPGDL